MTDRLRLLPGLRFNYDQKDVQFDQQVYGGLQTSNPALIALQQSIFAPQAYQADVDDTNLSGQITAAYRISSKVNAYATYATGFKSVGLNLNGVPTDAANQPVIAAATVKPEDVRNIEVGLKTELAARRDGEHHGVRHGDQGLPDAGHQRRRRGAARLPGQCREGARARRRARRQRPPDRQPVVLRRRGVYRRQVRRRFPTRRRRSRTPAGRSSRTSRARVLPGISKWALSLGGEYARPRSLFGQAGQVFGALDTSYRSSFSSSASYSRYLVVEEYSLVNARIGFRAASGWAVHLWSRNLLDKDYFELLTAAPGNTGLYVGQPGDGRTVGLTLRVALKSR